MNPLQRAVGLVMFMVGFVWMLLGLGLFGGSVISGKTWAAILGFVVLAIGLFVLTRKPKAAGAQPTAAPASPDAAAPHSTSDDVGAS
jgi:hypothetical protein